KSTLTPTSIIRKIDRRSEQSNSPALENTQRTDLCLDDDAKSIAYHSLPSASSLHQRTPLPSSFTARPHSATLQPVICSLRRPLLIDPSRPSLSAARTQSQDLSTTSNRCFIRISILTTTMHFHTIILAALSAGALSVSLTAKHLTDSKGLPNLHCTGKDNGESAFEIESFLVFIRLGCKTPFETILLPERFVARPPSQRRNADTENIKAKWSNSTRRVALQINLAAIVFFTVRISEIKILAFYQSPSLEILSGRGLLRHASGFETVMPPDGSYIWIDYTQWNPGSETLRNISVFSDTKCENFLTTVVPSTKVMNDGMVEWHAHDSNCVFMGEGVHWGSVKATDPYYGDGEDIPDGLTTWGNNLDP
ncbi:MAG: hypothetical protein Q9175_008349, partial [Cornicularia normoerica]